MESPSHIANNDANAEMRFGARLAGRFGGRAPTDEMAEVLDMLESLHGKPIQDLDADEARKQPTPMDAVRKLLDELDESPSPEDVGKIENKHFDGPGGDIDVRVYWPASAHKGELLPVTLYVTLPRACCPPSLSTRPIFRTCHQQL